MWWVIAGLLGVGLFLLLAILATMRETMVLRGDVAALKQLVTKPPAPSFAVSGGEVPAQLRTALVDEAERFESPASKPRGHSEAQLVVFVSEGCGPCETLISAIRAAVAQEALSWASPGLKDTLVLG